MLRGRDHERECKLGLGREDNCKMIASTDSDGVQLQEDCKHGLGGNGIARGLQVGQSQVPELTKSDCAIVGLNKN